MASIIGLCGAVVVVAGKLSGEYDEDVGKGIGAILVSAILYAYNLILQRRQALIAKPVEVVFFQTIAIFVTYLLLAPLLAVPPPMTALPNLVFASILAIVSIMLVSWAYGESGGAAIDSSGVHCLCMGCFAGLVDLRLKR